MGEIADKEDMPPKTGFTPMISSQIPRQIASKEKSSPIKVAPRPASHPQTALKRRPFKVSREGELLHQELDPVRR